MSASQVRGAPGQPSAAPTIRCVEQSPAPVGRLGEAAASRWDELADPLPDVGDLVGEGVVPEHRLGPGGRPGGVVGHVEGALGPDPIDLDDRDRPRPGPGWHSVAPKERNPQTKESENFGPLGAKTGYRDV